MNPPIIKTPRVALLDAERKWPQVRALVESADPFQRQTRQTRLLAHAVGPENVRGLIRLERAIDKLIAPGASMSKVLVAMYAGYAHAVDSLGLLARRVVALREGGLRHGVISALHNEIARLEVVKAEILADLPTRAGAIRRKLQQESSKVATLPTSALRREAEVALDESIAGFKSLAVRLEKEVDGRASALAVKAKTKAHVTRLAASGTQPARKVMSYRIQAVLRLTPDVQPLGLSLARRLRRNLQNRPVRALGEIEESGLFFLEALGVAAVRDPDKARLLRRFAEGGRRGMSATEVKVIEGYLGQMRGLLPEEVALADGYMASLFHRRAFEVVSSLPAELRSGARVEVVQGPLWAADGKGALRQFGDGCMLLTTSDAQTVLIGLNEIKAGFDPELMAQLFERADLRALGSVVTFLDAKGQKQTRTLVREIRGAKERTVNVVPIYAHGRTAGPVTAKTKQALQEMVDDQMRSGRDVWVVPLTLTERQNERFAEAALKEAVNTIVNAVPKFGL